MKHVLRVVLVFVAVLSTRQIIGAQSAPAQNPPAQAPTQAPASATVLATEAQSAKVADRLPVRRVILYKSGVGYFEHLGRVRGNQTVTVDFTSGQLDDVLKSLTALDLDGGRVSGVSYNSDDALNRRLEALRLPVGQQTTRAQFWSALRGAKLNVTTGATHLIGRLLSVEKITRQIGTVSTQVDAISIVTDAGDVQTIALDPGVNVRIVEAELNQEVGKYLSLVASARDQDLRRLAISTTGTGVRDLFVSYVSEVPVWKATYRLVLPNATETRKPLLQGWAIVDNTVGQDWENVELSLVAGSPQSFVQKISRPYYVQRPVVPLPSRMLLSPQTHQSAMGVAGVGALAGTVTDVDRGLIPGATVRVLRNNVQVGVTTTDASGRYQIANLPPGAYDVTFSSTGFRPVTRNAVDIGGGMETVLNTSMTVGVVADSVAAGGGGGGRGGGGAARNSTVSGLPQNTINLTMDGVAAAGGSASDGFFATMSPAARAEAVQEAMLKQGVDATGAQLGDLFEYKLKEPVTIRKNQSALVPIVAGDVIADKVSLWNATSGSPRALRAVWLTNTTGNTLDAGSFTVVEGQAFAGEGLVDSLKPAERRLLSYAIDLGVQIDAKGETTPTKVTKVQVNRGLVIQTTEERQKRTYTARNEDTEPRVLVVEHPVRAGWKAGGTIEPAETTPAWYRYRLSIAPKTTATFMVEETRPGQTQIAINSVTDDQIRLLVSGGVLTPAIEASLRQVITRKNEIARLSLEAAARSSEIDTIGRDQDRVRENMKSLKGSQEEKQLLQRYVKQLEDQENRLEVLRKEMAALVEQRNKAQADLAKYIEEMAG